MMEYFEANGIWYSPDDPSNAVGGTLKFDADGIYLVLIGSFREGWGLGVERYPLITGIIESSPYGSVVSLIDSFTQRNSFNMAGVTSERIRCNKAAIGHFHLSHESFDYHSLELGYTHLTEWAGRGGFEFDRTSDEPMTYVVTFLGPKDMREEFDDRSIILGTSFVSQRSAQRVVLTVDHRIRVEPMGEIATDNLGEDYVRMFQNLLSFATDRPNAIERIAYKLSKDEHGNRPNINLVANQMYTPKDKDSKVTSIDMLFVLDDLKGTGIEIFKSWSEFSKKHSEFTVVYFAYLYQSPKYLEDRFSKMLTAFKLFCTSLGRTAPTAKLCLNALYELLDARILDSDRPLVAHAIPDEAELGLAFVLMELLEENSAIMGKIVNDFSAFVHSISDTLYHVNKRVEGVTPPLEAEAMLWIMEKINALIKILVLKELGFGENLVLSLLERNRSFNYLKTI